VNRNDTCFAETRTSPDRRRAVAHKIAKEDGGPTTGWPRLAELTGTKESINAIMGWPGVTGVDLDETRSSVRVTQEDLNRLTESAWQAFAEANNPAMVFRRLNEPVWVERVDGGSQDKTVALSEAMLRHHAAVSIRWYTVKKDKQGRPRRGFGGSRKPVRVPWERERSNPVKLEPTALLSRAPPLPTLGPPGTAYREGSGPSGQAPEARTHPSPGPYVQG